MIRMLSIFLWYSPISHCISVGVVSFFLCESSVVLRMCFNLISYYFLIGFGIQDQICISSLIYICKMTAIVKSF